MKTTNSIHQSWLEKNFKKTVKYILADLKEYPFYYYMISDERMPDEYRVALDDLIYSFKAFCVKKYFDYEHYSDFSDYVSDLKYYMSHYLFTDLIFVEGTDWDDPDWVYNSLHIYFQDYLVGMRKQKDYCDWKQKQETFEKYVNRVDNGDSPVCDFDDDDLPF